MAKLRMTFEVDTTELFDRLHTMKGDTGPIGERIVGAMLTGEAGFGQSVGMAVYGVTIVSAEKIADT